MVEPYEIKDETYLYGWDTTKGKTIKSFILNNINNVLVLGSKFKNRYPDEGKSFPKNFPTNADLKKYIWENEKINVNNN